MKRRKLAAILAATMMLATGTTVFAEDSSYAGGTSNISGYTSFDVKAKYDASDVEDPTPGVVSVDFAWGKMEFTYKAQGKKLWDIKTHSYKNPEYGKWEAVGNNLTVTNHSDVPVWLDFSFAPSDVDLSSVVTGRFTEDVNEDSVGHYDGNSKKYRLAEGSMEDFASYENADSLTVKLTLVGDLPDNDMWYEMSGFGTVTVEINKAG